MNKRRYLRYLLALIAAAALAAAAILLAWRQGAFLPRWIVWEEKTLTLKPPKTANPPGNPGNNSHTDTQEEPSSISLNNRRLTVQNGTSTAWKSPDDILVQDFLWCDINHDEQNELILLCWRIGRYGNARPFWVEKDEKQWSQHIYIYQWRSGEIHPLWMASDIGMDVKSFDFDTPRRLHITEVSGRQTYWDWLSWGLTLIKEEYINLPAE